MINKKKLKIAAHNYRGFVNDISSDIEFFISNIRNRVVKILNGNTDIDSLKGYKITPHKFMGE